MGTDRIPLSLDREMHDEPFITTADHLRERQDKSMMPSPDDEDRQRENREQTTRRATRNRKQRSRTRRSRKQRSTKQQTSPDPAQVEKHAVQKVVRQLREKGLSDDFIRDNMDTIRERVRKELQ